VQRRHFSLNLTFNTIYNKQECCDYNDRHAVCSTCLCLTFYPSNTGHCVTLDQGRPNARLRCGVPLSSGFMTSTCAVNCTTTILMMF